MLLSVFILQSGPTSPSFRTQWPQQKCHDVSSPPRVTDPYLLICLWILNSWSVRWCRGGNSECTGAWMAWGQGYYCQPQLRGSGNTGHFSSLSLMSGSDGQVLITDFANRSFFPAFLNFAWVSASFAVGAEDLRNPSGLSKRSFSLSRVPGGLRGSVALALVQNPR